MRILRIAIPLGALAALTISQAAFAAVDYSSVTTGLLTNVEGVITDILPLLAGLMAAVIGWKYVRKFVGAKP